MSLRSGSWVVRRSMIAVSGLTLFSIAYCPNGQGQVVQTVTPNVLAGVIHEVNIPASIDDGESEIDSIKERLLLNQDLVHFVGRDDYAEAERPDQLQMLGDWLDENVPAGMASLTPGDRHNLVLIVQDSLDNLLSERDFGSDGE